MLLVSSFFLDFKRLNEISFVLIDEDFFSLIDMKMYHDREVIQNAILAIQSQNDNTENYGNIFALKKRVYQNILNDLIKERKKIQKFHKSSCIYFVIRRKGNCVAISKL